MITHATDEGEGDEDEGELANDIKTDDQLLQFDFATIKFATNDFSDANKLGQGGFGIVYKVLRFIFSWNHTYLDNILRITYGLNFEILYLGYAF